MTVPATKRCARARRSPEQIDQLVLDQLAHSDGPVSAYDIASRSSTTAHPIVANQVYRTLARLIDLDRVHRLESLSAYMLKSVAFDACLICDECRSVELLSAPNTVAQLKNCATSFGFTAKRTIIETHGRCAACAARTVSGAAQHMARETF